LLRKNSSSPDMLSSHSSPLSWDKKASKSLSYINDRPKLLWCFKNCCWVLACMLFTSYWGLLCFDLSAVKDWLITLMRFIWFSSFPKELRSMSSSSFKHFRWIWSKLVWYLLSNSDWISPTHVLISRSISNYCIWVMNSSLVLAALSWFHWGSKDLIASSTF
jgi:hypothetical protein